MKRIVVTGLGIISGGGCSIPTYWQNVLNAKSSASLITKFDCTAYNTKIAFQANDFKATDWVDAKKASRNDPSILFCIAAAKQAFQNAGLIVNGNVHSRRIGIIEGASTNSLSTLFETHDNYFKKGVKGIQISKAVNTYVGSASSEIAMELGIHGQASCIATTCTSGNDAVKFAADAIRSGQADVMLAGATDASITQMPFGFYQLAGVMSATNNLAMPMQPFDINHSGFVLGEGSCFLVLEDLYHALGRNATIYAEWLSCGKASEGYHQTATTPDGRGIQQALYEACLTANVPPSKIDYLCAHGSATASNESIETLAYKSFFGEHAYKLPISGLKPITGHMLAASSAVEAAACVLALHHQVIPPTAHLYDPIPGCDLDYVPLLPRQAELNHIMNVNMGFGGKVSATCFKRFEQ